MKSYSTEGVSIDNLHGKIEFNLTNDYMFRAVFQTNEVALKGLLCALLHLEEDEILHIEIQNPIELGKSLTDKEFRLDIKILLNDVRIINIELQVNNLGNWPERSLAYTCRMFDSLNRGDDYINVKPVVHIGILDFTLFKEHPSFYASYKMMEEENHYIYSDSFIIKTLDLTRTDLARDTDKRYNLDKWAKVFKATTWDELKILSQNNKSMREVAKSMHIMTEEEELRERMIERQEYYALQKYLEKRAKRADEADEAEARQKKAEARLKVVEVELRETRKALEEKDKSLAEKDKSLVEKDKDLAEKDKDLAEKDRSLAEKDKSLAEKDRSLAEKDKKIEELERLLKS